MTSSASVALFTRDLRVHDNPVLHAAARSAAQVIPLFVLDEGFGSPTRPTVAVPRRLPAGPRRRAAASSAAGWCCARVTPPSRWPRSSREHDVRTVHVAEDCQRYAPPAAAKRRSPRSMSTCTCTTTPLVVVPPGTITPPGRDHFSVFTPYHRRWTDVPTRSRCARPPSSRCPGRGRGRLPRSPRGHQGGRPRPARRAGSRAARGMTRWLRDGRGATGRPRRPGGRRDLAALAVPALRLPSRRVELVAGRRRPQARREAFVRQLAWRDFHHQVLAARPRVARGLPDPRRPLAGRATRT